VSEDPVRLGLLASLARPGGNVTGINFLSQELAAKRLELLRELVPGATRAAVLVNPANAGQTESTLRDVQSAARAIGLQIQVLGANTSGEIDAAFATFGRERPDVLFVGSSAYFTSRRVQFVQLAARHVMPAAYVGRQYVEHGGLMSYGATSRTRGANSVTIAAASSRAPSPRTCLSFRRAGSNWSSTTRPLGCSALPCPTSCSPARTR
jgi:putative ABC transport system substrate-binding protein